MINTQPAGSIKSAAVFPNGTMGTSMMETTRAALSAVFEQNVLISWRDRTPAIARYSSNVQRSDKPRILTMVTAQTTPRIAPTAGAILMAGQKCKTNMAIAVETIAPKAETRIA